MFQLDNRQIYKQLRQNKESIQDYQTHHQHLQARQSEGGCLHTASSNCFKNSVRASRGIALILHIKVHFHGVLLHV